MSCWQFNNLMVFEKLAIIAHDSTINYIALDSNAMEFSFEKYMRHYYTPWSQVVKRVVPHTQVHPRQVKIKN